MSMKISIAAAAIVASVNAEDGWLRTGGAKGSLDFENLDAVGASTTAVNYTKTAYKNGVELPVTLSDIGFAGDKLGGGILGALVNQDGDFILNDDGEVVVSQNPDFTSILKDKETGESLFMLTHFEAPRPGVAYLTSIEHDVSECEMKPTKYTPVSLVEDGGMWIPCAGSVTPWGTHLGSEEYEPDARSFEEAVNAGVLKADGELENFVGWGAANIKDFMRFFQSEVPTIEDYETKFFPYQYGHAWEFEVLKPNGEYTIKKQYGLGRVAFELCMTTPNGKTTYCTDDGTNVGFYKFEATTEGSYASGELSCGKFTQTDVADGGKFDIEWVTLGTVTDADTEIRSLAKTTRFSDIFETAEFANNACPEGFKAVLAGNWAGAGVVECLKLKDDTAATAQKAAFLETRRYCAMLGGTHEFTKWEGLTYDEETNVMYTALSDVTKGMLKESQYDAVTGDHVQLEANDCGCVFKLTFEEGTQTANRMEALLCGFKGEPANGEGCSENGIASPDNVAVYQGYNELLIAEDGRDFNHLWSYNLASENLVRIATIPAGGEATGSAGYTYTDVGGKSEASGCDYVLLSNQHPGFMNASVHLLGVDSYNVAIPSLPTVSPTAAPTTAPTTAPTVAEKKAEESNELTNGAKAGISLGFFFAISGALFIYLWKFDTKDAEQDLLIATENPKSDV